MARMEVWRRREDGDGKQLKGTGVIAGLQSHASLLMSGVFCSPHSLLNGLSPSFAMTARLRNLSNLNTGELLCPVLHFARCTLCRADD